MLLRSHYRRVTPSTPRDVASPRERLPGRCVVFISGFAAVLLRTTKGAPSAELEGVAYR